MGRSYANTTSPRCTIHAEAGFKIASTDYNNIKWHDGISADHPPTLHVVVLTIHAANPTSMDPSRPHPLSGKRVVELAGLAPGPSSIATFKLLCREAYAYE